VGVGLDGPLAWKFHVAEAPGASAVAHDGAWAVSVEPEAVTVAFHPFTSVTPVGRVSVDTHGFSAAVPLLRTITDALKPPGQNWSTR